MNVDTLKKVNDGPEQVDECVMVGINDLSSLIYSYVAEISTTA